MQMTQQARESNARGGAVGLSDAKACSSLELHVAKLSSVRFDGQPHAVGDLLGSGYFIARLETLQLLA